MDHYANPKVPCLQTADSITVIGCVQALDQMLEEAERNGFREKSFAVLKTAFLVGLVVASVFTGIFLPPVALAGALVLYLGASLLVSYSSLQSMKRIERLREIASLSQPTGLSVCSLAGSVLIAPALSLYEVFTRKSRLEKAKTDILRSGNENFEKICSRLKSEPERLELIEGFKQLRETCRAWLDPSFESYSEQSPFSPQDYQEAFNYVDKIIAILEALPEGNEL